MAQPDAPDHLVVVMPHPDDEAYSAGGLMALASSNGWAVTVICASFGERGRRHDGGPAGREALATARAAELANACQALRARPPVIWGLPDGSLQGVSDGATRVAQALAALSPSLVVTLGPDGAYGHPDHLAVNRWVTEAWEGAGRAFLLVYAAFPAQLFEPQWAKVRGMLGDPPRPALEELGVAEPHYVVPLGAGAARAKLQALGCHQTQLPGGDPEAIFPPGVLRPLLAEEWFMDAEGAPSPAVAELLASLVPSV